MDNITLRLPAVPFSDEYDVTGFRCESSPVNSALWVSASQDERWDRSRTYLIPGIDDGDNYFIAGFFTLQPHLMHTKDLPQAALPEDLRKEHLPSELPVIYLAYLGRDERLKGEGIGALLMLEVLHKALEAATIIGGTGIFAVAVSEQAKRLNTDFGFYDFDPDMEEYGRMFLPMSEVRRQVSDSSADDDQEAVQVRESKRPIFEGLKGVGIQIDLSMFDEASPPYPLHEVKKVILNRLEQDFDEAGVPYAHATEDLIIARDWGILSFYGIGKTHPETEYKAVSIAASFEQPVTTKHNGASLTASTWGGVAVVLGKDEALWNDIAHAIRALTAQFIEAFRAQNL